MNEYLFWLASYTSIGLLSLAIVHYLARLQLIEHAATQLEHKSGGKPGEWDRAK